MSPMARAFPFLLAAAALLAAGGLPVENFHAKTGLLKITPVRHAGVIIAPGVVEQGIQGVTVLRNGDSRIIGARKIEVVPGHNKKRGPEPGKLFHDKGRGNGYGVTFRKTRFYFSGDTVEHAEMRVVRNIDAAFICLNLPHTVPPEKAAQAVKVLRPRAVYPDHYRNSAPSVFEKTQAGTGAEVRTWNWYY